MRISDWSSDVCSSDLDHVGGSEYLARAVHDARAGIPIFVVVKVDAAPGFAFDYQMMTGGDQFGDRGRSQPDAIFVILDLFRDTYPHPRPDRKSTRLNSSH